ncbi:hypothetical protein ACI3EY_16640 [Ornithinimicrobium sp. LYQ92]|uniref:hypothetical protein n=1 Tax=Serinicoccus sp. LYQ92 TaxID=3378798 RepID=UPI003853B9F3
MPRLTTETYGGGDQSWLGSAHGIGNCRTGTLDVSTFTAGTHYPDGYIPSGTPVDCTDEGAVAPWAGTGQLGFVFTDQRVSGPADLPAPIFRHGIVKADRIPGDFEYPATGHNFTFVGGTAAVEGGGV